MTDRPTASTLIDGADPKLKTIGNAIREIMAEHEIAGCFQLASSTHAEFGMEVPAWSAIQFIEDESGNRGMHIKSNSKKNGHDHLESSVHLMLSMRDACAEQSSYLNSLGNVIEQALKKSGIEMEHKTIEDRKVEEDNDDDNGVQH